MMQLKDFKEVKRLLINIDMVNGFINCGAMADKGIAKIIEPQIELIEKCKNGEDYIIFVKEGHSEESVEFAKFPKHCIKGSVEAEIVCELKCYISEGGKNVYEKNSTSAIFAKDFLSDVAKMINLKEVVLMGCCTDICVLNLAIPLANYFDEINKKIRIVVPKNVVETFDSETHKRDEYNQIAFKLMKQAGIEVVDKYEK